MKIGDRVQHIDKQGRYKNRQGYIKTLGETQDDLSCIGWVEVIWYSGGREWIEKHKLRKI